MQADVIYDAVIVGGGVTGALVALKLAKARRRVLVLEAGTNDALDPSKYQQAIEKYYTLGSARSAPNAPYPPNLSALSPNDSSQHPYYVQKGPQNFLSDYLRMLGGTTLHWQGTSVRMLPNDFRMQSVYGQALDWPLSYDDLEPYYGEAEHLIGVSANVEDQVKIGVKFADGYSYPMQRMPQSVIDQFLDKRLQGASVNLFGGSYPLRVVSMPVARNSTPNAGFVPAVAAGGNSLMGSRCQGNSSCTPMCPVQAKYNALKTLEAAKKEDGHHVEVRPQCVASKLRIDPVSGQVTGVEYKRYAIRGQPDCVTEVAQGKIIILAANAIENAVLALASGIVDKSGQLGRNLMDHPYINLYGLAPEPLYPFRGPDTTSGVESLRDGKFREKHASFRAGIGNWGWNGEPAASVGALLGEAHFGKNFREQLRRKLTRMFKIGTMLEQLPSAANRVAIDSSQTDVLGNYLPVLYYCYDEYTLDGALAVLGTFWPEILAHTGVLDQTDLSHVPPGSQAIIHRGQTVNIAGSGHLVGTHRMGRTANVSVVDSHMRSWAHKNLFLVGGGSMVTIGTSNPTLTAAALSLRSADRMIRQLNDGD